MCFAAHTNESFYSRKVELQFIYIFVNLGNEPLSLSAHTQPLGEETAPLGDKEKAQNNMEAFWNNSR